MKNPLFNIDVLNNWQSIDPEGWKVIVKEILEAYFEVMPQQYEQLITAWRAKDLVQTGKAAHVLKSSFGNVGAEYAQALMDKIEKSVNENHTSGLDDLFMKLESLIPETQKEIEEFRKTI